MKESHEENPNRKPSHNIEILMRNLIDSSYDGIYVCDETGTAIWYNSSFLQISGLSSEDLRSNTVFELLAKNRLPGSAAATAITEGRTVTNVIDYYSGCEALSTATPVFDESGKIIRVIANVRDLTELNRLKQQLDESKAIANVYKQSLLELQSSAPETHGVIFRSPVMENVVSLARRMAAVDSPILILGESGVGKDVLARYIHQHSTRGETGTFVKFNCAAVPENLLESELFGYAAGAFTGANRNGKIGLFELADKGTIFLDEIGEMPLSLQVKLLGVLQDLVIQRVGGTKQIPVDVRIIAATNVDLETMIAHKQFRRDLYYRVNVLSLYIPPIRERVEDIFGLAVHFLDLFNQKYGKNKSLSPDSMDYLLHYEWPGNVRELKNLMERLVVISDEDVIDVSHVKAYAKSTVLTRPVIPTHRESPSSMSLKQCLQEEEKKILAEYLSRYRPMKRCASELGIDLATLVRKKKRYGL